MFKIKIKFNVEGKILLFFQSIAYSFPKFSSLWKSLFD